MKKLLPLLFVILCLALLATPAMAVTSVDLTLESLSMMGEGLPTLNWDPTNPANEMTREGNVFVKELGITAGTTIKFKFCGNGAWDSGFNFGSGSVEVGTAVEMANGDDSQDMIYTATETCILKFTVDCSAVADGGAATVLLEVLPPAEPPVTEVPTITISVDPFNDWSQIYIFVWNNRSEYTAWPGVQLKDVDNDGWYETKVPLGYTNFIISNSTGYQSSDLAMDGTIDIWVTMGADEAGMVTVTTDYFKPGPALDETTPIPKPDTLEFLSLVGEGLEGLNWEVSDPNNLMERNGDLFTKELFVPAGTELFFKFCGNGDWSAGFDYGVNFDYSTSEGPIELTPKGSDIPFSALVDTTLRFTVDTAPLASGGNPTLLLEQEVATYPVHVDPYDDWTDVYLYACQAGVIQLTTHPDDVLTDADGDGWFEIQVPMSYKLLQLHNGSNLATDLLEVTGQEVWLTMTDMTANTVHCDISYTDPGPAGTAVTPEFQPLLPESMSIVGSSLTGIPNWNPNAIEGLMDEIAPGIYGKEILIPSWTDISFKFVGNRDWDSGFNFGNATVILGEKVELSNNTDSTDIYLNQTIGCRLRFTLDLTGFDGTSGALLLVEEVPNEMRTVYVHAFKAWGTPYCTAWMDDPDGAIFYNAPIPGSEMAARGDWYALEIPVWCDRLRIYNGDEDESTEELKLNHTDDAWVVIEDEYDYWHYKATVYEDEPVIEPEPEDVTVYAYVPEDWTDVYCWAWSGSSKNAFESWPGEAMTKDGDWYTIQIPGWCEYVIINDYASADQTNDLSIEPGLDVWVDCRDYDNAEVYYEEPTLELPTEPIDPTEEPDEPTDPSASTGEPVETESTYPKMTRPHDYEEAEDQIKKAKKDSGSPLVIILIAVGAVVLIGGGVTLILVLKKKKKS